MDEMNNNYNPAEPAAPEQPTQPQYQQTPVQPQAQQPVQPQYQQAAPVQPQQYQQVTPVQADASLPTPTNILIFGIIGLALAWMPFGSIAGIIISAIGLKKSNAYVNGGGLPAGQATTGRILARIGLIVSIVMTVFWAIWFTIVIIAASTASSYYYSSYRPYY